MNKRKTILLPLAAACTIITGCANVDGNANSQRFWEAQRLTFASLGVLGDAAERENALTCCVLLNDAQTGEFVVGNGFFGDIMLFNMRYEPWNNDIFVDCQGPKMSELFMPVEYGRSFGGFYRTVAKSSYPTNAPRFNVTVAFVVPMCADDKGNKPETTADDVLPKVLEAMAEEEVHPMGDVLDFLRNRKHPDPLEQGDGQGVER